MTARRAPPGARPGHRRAGRSRHREGAIDWREGRGEPVWTRPSVRERRMTTRARGAGREGTRRHVETGITSGTTAPIIKHHSVGELAAVRSTIVLQAGRTVDGAGLLAIGASWPHTAVETVWLAVRPPSVTVPPTEPIMVWAGAYCEASCLIQRVK